MGEQYIRVYKKLDVAAIKPNLLIYGDLSAQCANCQAMDIKLEEKACTSCHTGIKYIAFRNVKNHLPKLQKIHQERPDIIFIDFEDYTRQVSASKAREFLK